MESVFSNAPIIPPTIWTKLVLTFYTVHTPGIGTNGVVRDNVPLPCVALFSTPGSHPWGLPLAHTLVHFGAPHNPLTDSSPIEAAPLLREW